MLLFADGFDAYGATTDLLKKWGANSIPANVTWNATAGRFGGGALVASGSGGVLTTFQLTPNQVAGRLGMAGWFNFSARPAGSLVFFGVMPNLGSWGIGITSSGQLLNFTGGGGNAPSIFGPNVCDGQWHWLEFLFTTTTTTATIIETRWIDGVLIGNFSEGVLNTGGCQTVGLASVTPLTMIVDDLIIADDQVGFQAGELIASSAWPIGPKRCETMWPSGAGANTNWSPLSGANYTNVDENPSDWDTTYVSASASGVRDSYAFPGTVQGINPLAAVVNVVAKNADVGSISIQGLTYSGSSYGLGDSKAAGSAYRTIQFPILRDPNTGAAWTKVGVNAAQFGVGVV